MKRAYVITEGDTDIAFLQRVLPTELFRDCVIVNAHGKPGLLSLARSLLVLRRTPLLVLMDSDTLDPAAIAELRGNTEDLIHAADASIPVKVVFAVPEIEAWLFAAPEAIERTLGEKLSPELVHFGKRDPKGVLEMLASQHRKPWDFTAVMKNLDAGDIQRIRALPEVAELICFLTDIQKEERAVLRTP